MGEIEERGGGKRARNRIETRQRIADSAFELFEAHGYEETSLEEVARVAGISPRTLFNYFQTKDELVDFFRTTDFDEALAQSLRSACEGKRPLEALADCLIELVQRYDSDRAARIDRLLNSTHSLRIRKQQVFLAWEQVALEALGDCFASEELADDLSTAAMVGIGALRLALARRRRSSNPEPLVSYLRAEFASLSRLAAR